MPRRCSFKIELDFPQPLAGVDEAGCAPLAGPVVAAAVILNRDNFPRGIDDSKNLPIEKRESLYGRITKVARWGVGMASVEEIDSINIYWARMLAMRWARTRRGYWSTAMRPRAGNGRPRQSSMVTPSAARSPPHRSSRRSPATGSWPITLSPIRATGGSVTGVIRHQIIAAHCASLGRHRSTAEASAWCAR